MSDLTPEQQRMAKTQAEVAAAEKAKMMDLISGKGLMVLKPTLEKKGVLAVRAVIAWKDGSTALFSSKGEIDPASVKIAAQQLISLDTDKALPAAAEVEALLTKVVKLCQQEYDAMCKYVLEKANTILGGPTMGPQVVHSNTLRKYVPAY